MPSAPSLGCLTNGSLRVGRPTALDDFCQRNSKDGLGLAPGKRRTRTRLLECFQSSAAEYTLLSMTRVLHAPPSASDPVPHAQRNLSSGRADSSPPNRPSVRRAKPAVSLRREGHLGKGRGFPLSQRASSPVIRMTSPQRPPPPSPSRLPLPWLRPRRTHGAQATSSWPRPPCGAPLAASPRSARPYPPSSKPVLPLSPPAPRPPLAAAAPI